MNTDMKKLTDFLVKLGIEQVEHTNKTYLAHLVGVLRDLKDENVVFEFDSRNGESMVFPRAQMVAATEGILTDNGVRAQGSADMLAVWQGKEKGGGK